MTRTDHTRPTWVAIGALGLPLYGLLTLWSSIDPQPDPNGQYEAWARFVTTDRYLWGHFLGSGLGLILSIYGTIALGAILADSRARTMGLIGSALAIGGAALFLLPMGVSTFMAPAEGMAYLVSGQRPVELPATLASQVFATTFLVVIVLSLIGNVLLGIATWRSGALPRWTGLMWLLAPVLMYPLGVVYALLTGSNSTPPTVPLGAAVLVIAGIGMAVSIARIGRHTR